MLGVAGVTTMAGVFALALVATPRVAAMARVIRALVVVVRGSGGAVVLRVLVLGRVMTVLGRRVVIVMIVLVMIVLVVSGCLGALHHRLSSIPLGGI